MKYEDNRVEVSRDDGSAQLSCIQELAFNGREYRYSKYYFYKNCGNLLSNTKVKWVKNLPTSAQLYTSVT